MRAAIGVMPGADALAFSGAVVGERGLPPLSGHTGRERENERERPTPSIRSHRGDERERENEGERPTPFIRSHRGMRERESETEKGLPPLSGHTGRERENERERGLPPLSGQYQTNCKQFYSFSSSVSCLTHRRGTHAHAPPPHTHTHAAGSPARALDRPRSCRPPSLPSHFPGPGVVLTCADNPGFAPSP